jgi:hypothetical protein
LQQIDGLSHVSFSSDGELGGDDSGGGEFDQGNECQGHQADFEKVGNVEKFRIHRMHRLNSAGDFPAGFLLNEPDQENEYQGHQAHGQEIDDIDGNHTFGHIRPLLKRVR